MDALSIVHDEVALEGLDGITIPSLWIRLGSRTPSFPLKLDSYTKEFIWRSLINNVDLDFYELPKERVDVELLDRFADINPDTGIQTTTSFSNAKNDVYPVTVVLDDKDGIQGSCLFYKQRKNVTKNVRTEELKQLVCLEEAVKRYGRKLVVVASQKMRFRILIGEDSDPDLRISDQSYCILERLGRARWQGELQRDLHSSFRTEPGKLHYLRRCLDRHGLITMQSHVIRLPTGQQQHSILLLMKRYHVLRRSKYDILMEYLSNTLQDAPGQIASIITLRELLNVHERTFKHVYNYMLSYKLVQLITQPLEDLNPSAGPCNTKKGTKITVRCLKLLKPYQKKELMVEEDDDENEDGVGVSRKGLPQQDIIMERDLVLQAYHIVVSSGTKGISQSSLQVVMNVGKLEARMLCRRLERDGMIKGFMVDVGRQRTTKFIGHKSVSASDHMQQFVKERERNQLLCNSEPLPEANAGTPSSAPKALPTCKASSTPRPKTTKGTPKAKAKDIQRGDPDFVAKGKKRSVGGRVKKAPVPEQQALAALITPIKRETPETSVSEPSVVETPCAAESSQEEEGDPVLSPIVGLDEREALDSASDDAQKSIKVVEDMPKRKKQGIRLERSHETYRLLKRKNMIVEVVRSVKIVEGLYALQKMINDNEKLDGSSTKCCKKSILRLIRLLSKEGLVKMFRTTVIQDGVSKKVEFVVHPSVQPNDNMVKSAIEQVRFRISGSYAVARVQQEQAKQGMELSNTRPHTPKSKKNKEDKKTSPEAQDAFIPTTVRGLSRTLGFQPKMHRLRLVHTFLWYVVYGPYQKGSTGTDSPKPSQPADDNTTSSSSSSHSSSSKVISAPAPENGQNGEGLNPSDCENTNGAENAATAVASTPLKSGETALPGDEVSVQTLKQRSLESNAKVFADELSWKRYLPPLRVHKEFGYGWALVSDVVLCLPLSIFVQVTQINFKIEGLDEYLNDPVKQHYLVRVLPSQIKRQLLYKRKYIFAFYENLQKLVYMGLLQFGPMEKFQDKDQVFIFIRQHATIVDTTSAEPHYWQVTENPDKPFERRQYQFSTAADVENYWFDLLCVCLNTPLGLVRGKRGGEKEITMPSLVLPDRSRFLKLAYLLKGRRDEMDDGSTPGDGKGAGGLDSEFFAHLKRNWLWTNYLLACKKNLCDGELINSKMRLKSLLSKNALRLALKAGESTAPRGMTTKRAKVMEFAEVGVEPACRNQQVIGGKRQKRKRTRKEVVKVPRKKRKEAKTRLPAHDEADHRALKMMTRQRVFWSLQEDSMLMLCGVAAKLLNDKLTRPFVPYCVVRDMLQAELENSMDKTSLAVGRRTRYILKNPQTLLNHRICLAEVYQDKALMDELELKKPADPNKLEDCAQAFSEYTRLLRHKFSSSTISCDVTLPETKSLLFSRYKVFTIDHEQQRTFKDDLICTEDIHAIVLHNLIQSTLVMSNSQMKSSRSFQTFHMYSLFNQEVLCQVFIQCRKRGLVNRRRVHKAYGPKKNRALPILPMSYQLSQTYYKCFTWRFPTSLCTDAFRFLRALRDNGTGDAHKITSFYNEAESRMDVPPAPSGPGTTEGSPVESAGTKDQGEGGSGGLKGTDGGSGDQKGTDRDLKGASGDLKGTDGATGDLKGTDGATGDLKGTDGATGDLKGTDGATGDLKGTDGATGDLKGTDGATGDLKGTDGATGDLNGIDGATGDLNGIDGGSGDLKGTDGGSGDLKGTDGDTGDLKRTDGDSGDLQGTDGDSGDLKVTEGDSGDLKGTDGDTGDLKVPVEEPVSEAMIQADGPDTVSPAEPGESNQSKQGEEPVEMEEGNGEGEVPGVDAKPQTQRSTAQDSFVVNAGGLVPAPRSAESPSAQEEHHQDLSDMMHLSLDSPGGMCAAALTLMSLGLLSVHVSIPKEVVLVDNTVVKTDVVKRLTALEEEDEEDDADDGEGKKRLPGKATVSHTSYLMMKGYCYPGIVQLRNLSTCDNIVVDPCTLRFKLRDTPAHQIFSAQDSPPLDLTRCGPSLIPAVLSRSLRLPSRSSSTAGQGWAAPLKAYWGFSQQDTEACGALRASLDRAGEGGLGEEQLHRDLAHLEQPLEGRTRGLQQYMQVLEEECQAVRVGAQGVRWVLAEHARPWLLTVRLRPGLSQGYTKGRLRPRWQTRHSIPFMRKRAPEVAATMVMRMEEADEEEEDAEPPRKRGRGGNGSAMEDGLVAEEKEKEVEEVVVPSVEDGKTRKGGEEGEVRENGLEKEREGSDNEEVLSPPPSTAPSGGGDEEMSYISRPWRMVDGSINRLACKGMLEGLLYHVMARPGITQHCLVEHYQNTLQPMAVLDLIQALIDMGCVRRKSVVSRKATLFSRHADPPTEPAAATSGPGATDTWFYEPTISCVLRLAQVLPNEPHWNQYV
ncbi:unnamed protein product [Boreogadus saida]